MKRYLPWAAMCLPLLAPSCLWAAIGADVTPTRPLPTVTINESFIRPASTMTNWITVCDLPTTADNAGSTVVNPGGITRAEQHWLQMLGTGTTVQIRLRYPTAGSVSTDVVVQPFGRDANGIPQRLLDSTGTHALTLGDDTTNDARDGTYSYTQPVEVDADANKEVLIAVKTALAGSGLTNAVIQARIK